MYKCATNPNCPGTHITDSAYCLKDVPGEVVKADIKHIATVIYSKCGVCAAEFKGSETIGQGNAYADLLEHFREVHKGQGHTCGRRAENYMDRDDSPMRGAGALIDIWAPRDGVDRCSYCGSISPEELFKRIADGKKICPTDKSYKIYVEGDNAKFYFQHLSREACQRFIDCLNDGSMQLAAPGYFYTRPYFIAPPPRLRGQSSED